MFADLEKKLKWSRWRFPGQHPLDIGLLDMAIHDSASSLVTTIRLRWPSVALTSNSFTRPGNGQQLPQATKTSAGRVGWSRDWISSCSSRERPACAANTIASSLSPCGQYCVSISFVKSHGFAGHGVALAQAFNAPSSAYALSLYNSIPCCQLVMLFSREALY